MVYIEVCVENSFILDISHKSKILCDFIPMASTATCILMSLKFISFIDHDTSFQNCSRLYYCLKLLTSFSWKRIVSPGLFTIGLAMLSLWEYTSLHHWGWLWPCDLLQLLGCKLSDIRCIWAKTWESLQGWLWACLWWALLPQLWSESEDSKGNRAAADTCSKQETTFCY